MAATENAMNRKYAAVRIPIVSGLPTEGGLAGYLRVVLKAIARSTCGSPIHRAKTKEQTRDDADQHPAKEQCSIHSGAYFLVTGKAEEMTSVMHELVNNPALDERSRALLRADEINRQQHQKAAE